MNKGDVRADIKIKYWRIAIDREGIVSYLNTLDEDILYNLGRLVIKGYFHIHLILRLQRKGKEMDF